MKLTKRQKTAIEDPCLLACETVKRKYVTLKARGRRAWSSMLTVNNGYE